MELGHDDELPEAAKGEDLTTLSGRLRAAMVRAGKRAHYAVLKQMLIDAGFEIGKQTVHNWFRPSSQFIEQIWLFRVCKLLDVSPEWLSMGEGSMTPPRTLSDEHEQAIALWNDLPDDAARSAWLSSGHTILELLKKESKAAPFKAEHAKVTVGKRESRKA